MHQLSYSVGGIEIVSQSSETQKTNRSWTLIYVKSGAGLFLLENHLRGFTDGDLFIVPPRLSYSFVSEHIGGEYNESVDAIVLQFGEAWLDGLLEVFRTCSNVALRLREMKAAITVNGTKWLKVSSLMNELKTCAQKDQPVKILQILDAFSTKADLSNMSGEVKFDDADASEKIRRIRRYVDCNLLNKITLDEISAYAGMNRTYFCLFFKKHFGVGLTDYINSERIGRAKSMLKGGQKCVSDIARECGFPTVTYFNRIFRKSQGMSPTEYRRTFLL